MQCAVYAAPVREGKAAVGMQYRVQLSIFQFGAGTSIPTDPVPDADGKHVFRTVQTKDQYVNVSEKCRSPFPAY